MTTFYKLLHAAFLYPIRGELADAVQRVHGQGCREWKR